jgi:putative membrane-bound dehydrogenase-like protein
MIQRVIRAFLLAGIGLLLPQLHLPAPAADTPKKAPAVQGPLSPQDALKHFRLAPGLRMELVACEPQIESPVAMAFDEDGKLWVVEMRDYPNGPKRGEKPAGRIRILEDRDGDGFFEHSTIFAENLLFANGLLPWRGGVLVTAAPAIMHLERGPDGKEAKRTVLFEGFSAKNPQLRVSHPNLGIDNWIYVANGLQGGIVKGGKDPAAKPIDLSGMDFRFDLLHNRYEAISGMGQYGNTFDDWGRRFVCDNRHHLRHVVMESRYLKRNPYLAANAVVEDISVLDDGPLGSGGKIYPISSNWTTSSLHEGYFTAACSVFIYRGDLLGKQYRGSAFTCDPTGNLVHREIMEPHGATFRSRPDRRGIEFLASPDDWFRPVFLTTGPDDALYVVDMYRAVIEHPEWMPPELQQRPDLALGKDKGRIWRIVPEGIRPQKWSRRLSKASTADLLGLLSARPWERTTGQRLLLERKDKFLAEFFFATAESLDILAAYPVPEARVHAAWLLESFGRLSDVHLGGLLQAFHPRVREHGVLLAESRLKNKAGLRSEIIKLAGDPDARVRFQVALSLGEWDDDGIVEPLARIALAGVDDPWTRLAVATAVPRRAGLLVSNLLKSSSIPGNNTPSQLLLIQELFTLVGARLDAAEVEQSLRALADIKSTEKLAWQLAGLNGVTDGMGRRGIQLEGFLKTLPSVKSAADPGKAALVLWLDALLLNAAQIAANQTASLPDRVAAIRMLAHASWPVAEPKLSSLMADAAQEIRLAAVRSLAAHNRPEVAGLLMKSWRAYTPAVRREVLEAMLRQPARVELLLDELQARHVKSGDIDAPATRRLLSYPQPKLRARAVKLLQDNLPADRKLVLARYQESLKLAGDSKRGRETFKKNCATCHRIAGIGVDVGPDISDTRTRTAAALLVDILNPNQAIDNNAMSYLVVTKSGKSLTGLIAAETAASITLRRAEGQTDVVLRQDIDEIQSTGISLMPEGLEKSISIHEMADLLGFLKNWRYLDGKVPVGK